MLHFILELNKTIALSSERRHLASHVVPTGFLYTNPFLGSYVVFLVYGTILQCWRMLMFNITVKEFYQHIKKNIARDCWTIVPVTVEQSCQRLLNNRSSDCFFQRFFNSHWPNSSAVAGVILQQSLPRLFNSHWQHCSTVPSTILQQSLA